MARTHSSNKVVRVDFTKKGVSVRRFTSSVTPTEKQLTETVAPVETVQRNPWVRLIGKYKDDRTWQSFDSFLRGSRAAIDTLYAESQREVK